MMEETALEKATRNTPGQGKNICKEPEAETTVGCLQNRMASAVGSEREENHTGWGQRSGPPGGVWIFI